MTTARRSEHREQSGSRHSIQSPKASVDIRQETYGAARALGLTTDGSGSQSEAMPFLIRVRWLSPSSRPKQLSKSLHSRQLGALHSEKPSASQSLR